MSEQRTPLSKKLRFDIFKRDGFACQYCGAHPPQAVLECDHIVPVADGGGNEDTNLITACFDCNRGKAAIRLSEVPRSLADRATELSARASDIAEREEQIAGYEAVMRAQRQRINDNAQEVVDEFCNGCRRDGISRAEFQSILRFIEKIGLHEVLDAAEIATGKYPYYYPAAFQYFCGICWKKIKKNEAA